MTRTDTTNTKRITAEEVEEILAYRFSAPAWAFLPQVRNATGMYSSRTADALAMGLWPSRGLFLNGFEIKVNRGDWLSELKNPAKADEIAGYCDFWWIVAPKEIVKEEEVPAMWGFMIPFGKTTKIIKPAPQLKPQEPDRLFLAAILRKAHEKITPTAKLKAEYERGLERGRVEEEHRKKYEIERYQEDAKAVKDFEKISGIKIDRWNGENIAKAVKMVLEGEHLKSQERLEDLLKTSKKITSDIENALSENQEANKGEK